MAGSSAEKAVFNDISSYAAYFAVLDGEHSEGSLRTICDFWRQQGGKAIDERGNTLLHFLAIYGNWVALIRLLDERLLTSQDLGKASKEGNTPLHEAARLRWKKFARIMRDQDEDLVLARNYKGETPVYVAVKWGNGEVFCLFYETVQSESAMTRFDGRTVLHAAITEEYYSVAIRILQCFPSLANKADEQGTTALHLLARKPSSFFSGSSYYPKNLASWPYIPLQILAMLFYISMPVLERYERRSSDDEESQDQIESQIFQGSILVLVFGAISRGLSLCLWIIRIGSTKQKHTWAMELVQCLVKQEEEWISGYVISKNPLIEASRNGIIEIVREILDKFPYAAYSFDEFGKNLLHIAVEQKDQTLYDYLRGNIASKDMLEDVDNDGNTVLHLATKLGTSPRVLLGNLDQMTWDVLWFKRVFYDSMPHFLNMKNKKGKTPKELFKESYGPLEKKCEKALKDMNNGLMAVAALIGAVNYAALFTIPGGYDQDSKSNTYGFPVLHEKEPTKLTYFLRYICLALFGSLMAFISMLFIQLSPFRSNDFHMALPFVFLVAMTSLLWAALYSFLACLLAFTLDNLKNDSHFFWLSVIAISLLYTDTICMTVVYMYYALRYSFHTKGQEILDLI